MRRHLTGPALAIVAALGFATAAQAQVSEQRIPLRKGSEPVPVRTDTVVLRDTVRTYDTVTVIRRDTVVQQVELAPIAEPGGRVYFGLNGGAALPTQALNITHSPGYTVGAMLGWDSFRSPFGVRVDGGYTKLGEESEYAGGLPGCIGDECNGVGDPELLHANLDLKLRLPFMREAPVKLYAVGGATWNRFRGFTFVDDETDVVSLSSDNWTTRWGGNVGGGLAFGFGNTNLFLESRLQLMTVGGSRQNHVPIVLGITF